MEYIIRVEKEIDLSRAEKALISNSKWTEGYAPEAYAQLIYIEGRGCVLKMTAMEENPKAEYTKYNDPVYKDSCLEFFVRFNSENPKYMNFEMNSNGAFLAAIRTDRKNKTPGKISKLRTSLRTHRTIGIYKHNITVFFAF